ncbi:hypothetical protein [Saccharolobus caldissimus]|uniref:Uncharacterized protein n=1 Tax=Saccharolobus caldissimus TaxID=1702097 RepID=A0AAQ4CRD8_9CREN|nr:hypothetical protein [Saccharolobus caldissimus]BDB98369.1 hypothetical protein SACC_13860 [Saccharolobus caldissimus]
MLYAFDVYGTLFDVNSIVDEKRYRTGKGMEKKTTRIHMAFNDYG